MRMPSPVERQQLRLVAADVVFGTLREEEAVDLASRLVANGTGGSATVELAAQPARLAQLRYDEVEPLVRAMLDELEIGLPRAAVGGWGEARRIAHDIVRGTIAPPDGALALWRLWTEIRTSDDPLVEMLILHDRWEQSVGAARAAIEQEMIEAAEVVEWYAEKLLDAGPAGLT